MNSLESKIIISTRPLSENDSIKNQLVEKGAIVLDFPMIKICPADLDDKIEETLRRIATYQWIVFTSKNGVDYFFKLLRSLTINTSELSLTKIAVVGKKTSEEVLKNNCIPFLLSTGSTSEDLLTELIEKINPLDNILLVLGEMAGDTLQNGLHQQAFIQRINVYKTLPEEEISEDILERIKKNDYDLILFTSSSGFIHFNSIMLGNIHPGDFRTACTGRSTAKTMISNNCQPLFISAKADGEAFVKELELFFTNNKI